LEVGTDQAGIGLDDVDFARLDLERIQRDVAIF